MISEKLRSGTPLIQRNTLYVDTGLSVLKDSPFNKTVMMIKIQDLHLEICRTRDQSLSKNATLTNTDTSTFKCLSLMQDGRSNLFSHHTLS